MSSPTPADTPPGEIRRNAMFVAAGAAGCLTAAGAMALGGAQGTGIPCAFQALTGLPCPLCGGTRALTAAVSWDPAYWDHNIFWPPVIVLLLVLGLYRAMRPRRGPVEVWILRRPVLATALLLAAGWGPALLNRATIVG